MAISFDSVDLPNGSTVPIRAVAVDTNLRSLKGQVTGSSRGKAMLVATLSGIGQTTAMMLGNNTSTALSGQDMMRSQLSQNMGNTADTQIAKMISNERIVVTLAAGTEFYMVFTKAALPQNSAQQSSLATYSSHIQPISSSLSGR
jgi:type IV secretory pathway VirB10-like protein